MKKIIRVIELFSKVYFFPRMVEEIAVKWQYCLLSPRNEAQDLLFKNKELKMRGNITPKIFSGGTKRRPLR